MNHPGQWEITLDKATCTTCDGSTPKGSPTVVLARRIVIKMDESTEKVRDATACCQLCPECVIKGATQSLEIGCMMPPLLPVEGEIIMQFIRRTQEGKQLSQVCALPPYCTLCRDPIPLGVAFVYVEVSQDWTTWDWTEEKRFDNFRVSPPSPRHKPRIRRPAKLKRRSMAAPRNKVPVLNACAACAETTWGLVDLELGRFSNIPPCSTPGCPYCAPKTASRVEERQINLPVGHD